ncbi:MAG: hypothetical protein IJO29_07395 [Oscillospiraceae bacterium]|nr:hypothetical protein [Oscillospiraceae bacterium]
MDNSNAIQKMCEIYEKMLSENFTGQLSYEDGWIIWKMPNDIIIKSTINIPPGEGYICAYYFDGKKENALTHWHPEVDEIYEDLMKINCGEIFWISTRRKSRANRLPVMFEKYEWDELSEDIKNMYIIL